MDYRPLTRILSIATLSLILAWGAQPSHAAQAEQEGVDEAERNAVVQRVHTFLSSFYVYEDVGTAAAADLVARNDAGEFDGLTDPTAFAARLTEVLQAAANDRHLRVRVREPETARVADTDPEQARRDRAETARRRNYGFEKVERLEGNIGYVDLRYFDGTEAAQPTAAAAMNFIANTDAVIFDLRQNGGGSPQMIRYISSWFFAEPTHLNSFYQRRGDRLVEFWTHEEFPGTPRPEVPIFVLTSNRTFSGAEEFSYNMLTQMRGTLVGEVTGGGANPGGTRAINDRFEIFVPTGAAVNPITGTNWEGVGVTPHIQVSAEEALDVALESARAAAEEYRAGR